MVVVHFMGGSVALCGELCPYHDHKMRKYGLIGCGHHSPMVDYH